MLGMHRLQSELTVATAVGHQTNKRNPGCALSDVPADIPLGAKAVPVPEDDQSEEGAEVVCLSGGVLDCVV